MLHTSRPSTSTSNSSSGKQTDSNATSAETIPSFYGVGSLAGKAIYALGVFVLDSLDPVVLRLRLGFIRWSILADDARDGPYDNVLDFARSSKYGRGIQHSALGVILEKIKSRKFRRLTEAIGRLSVGRETSSENKVQRIFKKIFDRTREMLQVSNVDTITSVCDFISHVMEQMKGVQPERCSIRRAILDAGLMQLLGDVKVFVEAETGPELEQICRGNDIQKLIDRMTDAGSKMWGTHQYRAVRSESLRDHSLKLVTRPAASTIYLRDSVTGQELGEPLRVCDRSDHLVWTAFSPDYSHMSAVSEEGVVYMWNLTKRRVIWKRPWRKSYAPYPVTLWTLLFSPDGSRIALGLDDGTVSVWESATGKAIGKPLKGAPEYKHLEFSPNGGRIALAGEKDSKIRVWDVAS